MKNEIKYLFDDIDYFAKLIAKVQIKNKNIEKYRFEFYEMMVDIIITPKEEFENNQTAFAGLFKKQLFGSEEWDINDEPSPYDEKWINALKKSWIKDYFLTFEGVNLENINSDEFIRIFKSDLNAVGTSQEVINKFLNKLTNVEVIQVKKASQYYKLFGRSDTHYFSYEYGIYA